MLVSFVGFGAHFMGISQPIGGVSNGTQVEPGNWPGSLPVALIVALIVASWKSI